MGADGGQAAELEAKLIVAPTAYDASFFRLVRDPSAAEGVMMPISVAMFLGEGRSRNPAVATFDEWLAKIHPGFQPDLFRVYGWTLPALFVPALKQAGNDVTPASVRTAVGSIHGFDASGLVANGSARQPSGYYPD